MSLPAKTQVLIVGAGPNGLACALTLARLGVQVTIVDSLPCIKYGSRACLVHARTLEVLDTIGLATPLMKLGIPSKGVTFHGDLNTLFDVDVTVLRDQTSFPVVLLLPQHDIERIFQEKLTAQGVEVIRNQKVVAMKEICPEDELVVTFEGGDVVHTRYVVGADGSRSTIRRLAGIDFSDPHTGDPYDCDVFPTSALHIVLSDIFFEEPLPESIPRDAVSWHLNKRLLLCPLPLPSHSDAHTDKKNVSFWRIGIVVPVGAPAPPRHPDIHYLQGEIDMRKPWKEKVTISSLVTGAAYRVRSAVAKTFFKKMAGGNVLLVGDAAHVHSPSGGQGMNLGLCDAVALGNAIKAHVSEGSQVDSGKAPDLPLIDYSTSRRKTAVIVIGMTKRLTAIVNAATGWRKVLRNIILWIAGSFPLVRRRVAWRLSGLVHRGL